MYMLDTNICIYIIKKRPGTVLTRFEAVNDTSIHVSIVTFAELRYGIERSSSKTLNTRVVNAFIANLTVLPWDTTAAIKYGKIRHILEQRGTPIGAMDLLIAAHSLSSGFTLVTNNVREFERVPGLTLENWA